MQVGPVQMSTAELQSALTQPNGALQNLVAVGNPTSVAAFVLSVAQTITSVPETTSSSMSSQFAEGNNITPSPAAQQQAIGTLFGFKNLVKEIIEVKLYNLYKYLQKNTQYCTVAVVIVNVDSCVW